MNKSRQSNLELLRIVSALAVVFYHMFSQSGAFSPENSTHFRFAVCLGGGGRVACAIFVMIGAYFLVDETFRFQRILRLWLKVIIVVVLVNGVVFLVDPTLFSAAEARKLLFQFFPVFGRPYWFISDYIALLLVSPFLNLILYSDNLRRYLKWVLGAMVAAIVVLSFFPTEFKHSIFFNDFIYFCFLYVFTGYIKLYSTSRIWNHKYLLFCIAIFSYSLICLLAIILDKIKDTWSYAWEIRFFYMSTYQAVLGFVCASATFQLFLKLELGSQKLINGIGHHALGIYIVHQVPILYINDGWIWNEIFHLNSYFNKSDFNVICVAILLIVVTASICLDTLCNWIVNRIIQLESVSKTCKKINQLVIPLEK